MAAQPSTTPMNDLASTNLPERPTVLTERLPIEADPIEIADNHPLIEPVLPRIIQNIDETADIFETKEKTIRFKNSKTDVCFATRELHENKVGTEIINLYDYLYLYIFTKLKDQIIKKCENYANRIIDEIKQKTYELEDSEAVDLSSFHQKVLTLVYNATENSKIITDEFKQSFKKKLDDLVVRVQNLSDQNVDCELQNECGSSLCPTNTNKSSTNEVTEQPAINYCESGRHRSDSLDSSATTIIPSSRLSIISDSDETSFEEIDCNFNLECKTPGLEVST